MENELSAKRNLVLALVIVTILIFIGLVWLVSVYFPLAASGTSMPTHSAGEMGMERNCTYPIAYWAQYPGMIPGRIVVGNREYLAEEIEALLSKKDNDLVADLQAQLVGAYLNIQSGAEEELIRATIFQAYGWVVEHPQGTPLAENERVVGVRLFNILEAYNLGLAGVSACPDANVTTPLSSPTATGTPSAVSTATKTLTSTRTSTSTARASVSPTVRLTTPARRTSSPTATREATNEPINTPVPTTQAAPATPTYATAPTHTPFVPTPTHTPFVPTPTRTTAPTLTPPPPPTSTPTTPPPLP